MPRVDTQSRNTPVIPKFGLDTSNLEIGQSNDRVLRSSGAAKDALDNPLMLDVDTRPVDQEKLAMMNFMNEPVTIRIGTTTDKNAPQVFDVQINLKTELFRRGETKTVKRQFVAKLASLKQTVYTQREVVNNEGVKDYLNVPHTALLYDFQVVRDDNPRGADWLAHVLMQPG